MENKLLEQLLAAQVLLLARQIKAEKEAKGTHTTSDCIADAVREIKRDLPKIVEQLR